MSSSSTVQFGGVAVLSGAVIVSITALSSALAFVGSDPTGYANDPLFVPVNVASFAGALLALLGVPVAFVALHQELGLRGAIGIALVFLAGLMLAAFLPLLTALTVPHASGPLVGSRWPSGFLPLFVVGATAQAVGAVLLAIPIVQGRIGRRWIGVLLPLAAVGVLVSPLGSGGSLLLSLISALGELLLMVALMAVGYRLLVWAEPAARAAART